ncbi:GxxExxY protein [Draconibacterium orientale]|jgi:GxxExxY protein|uniref:GxxExxY protein n=1 Tax=Draconibacterium orientale TaxID=1168034 RepID=UPI002A0A9198|nr:GxxExxY protein [Draconibacterium orientale]
MQMDYKYSDLTEAIIKCFYKVYNELGYGFLEKVYHNALLIELQNEELKVESQKPIKVSYQGDVVGEYYADIIVEDVVILELKATETVTEAHEFQLINYLKATGLEVGLLLNFGKKPQVKRKVFTNQILR